MPPTRPPFAIVLALAGCAAPTADAPRTPAPDNAADLPSTAPDTADDHAPSAPTPEPRVLVIGIDGLRPDALSAAATPNLDALVPDRCRTLSATTHLTGPTLVSGPGWASILTGVEVSKHGVESNDDLATRDPAWPSFLERARGAGVPTAAVIHWLGILPILSGPATDALDTGTDADVGAQLAARISAGEHRLIFTHFDDVDGAGHSSGFSPDNPAYVAAIEEVDRLLGDARTALAARPEAERWLVALVTDHGGTGTGHGPRLPGTETIPVGACVDGTPTVVPDAPTQMDVAPTALDWLGVPYDGLDGASWLPAPG